MEIQELYQLFEKHPIISTDTRTIPENAIFFALKGASFDANQFAKQALQQGASFCVIDNPECYLDERTILVENVLNTLQKLANYHREQLSIPIIAITGTNGKTTTKELVNKILAQKYSVVCTKGNLNNHIGIPLTLLSIPKQADMAIVEMGANHPQEIEILCNIANPNFGLITNIGRAHLEGFGGFEGVIKTKTELYNHLEKHCGMAFVNGNDPLLMDISAKLHRKTYGTSENCNYQGAFVAMNPFIKAGFKTDLQWHEVQTQLIGKYNINNILAAISVGLYFEVDAKNITAALENYHPDNMRSQVSQTEHNQLIIDTYNANPTSMNAALSNFFDFSGNKALILGDMLELGAWSKEEHTKILEIIEQQGIETVFLVGKQFSEIAKKSQFHTFENVSELINHLKKNPIADTFILIKGSRGIQLEQVIPFL